MDEDSWLELRQVGLAPRTVTLANELTIGRDTGKTDLPPTHIPVVGDATVSELHAIFLRRGPGWCVQVPTVTNGLFVNGVRLAEGTVQLLRANDEIRIGERTAIIFRSIEATATGRERTAASEEAPELTAGERRVLLSLCRPVLGGNVYTEPASVAEIAKELFVSQSAVKQHLGHLYDKFRINEDTDPRQRRARLANEAVQRGAVRLVDL
jgi:pSer/pThr/pTyr-binding forkhead associated (FHA) protein